MVDFISITFSIVREISFPLGTPVFCKYCAKILGTFPSIIQKGLEEY